MTNLEEALKYYRFGFSVFPLLKGTKDKPIYSWKRYSSIRATEDQIKNWWTKFPDANIAIITGKVSNLFVLDTEKGFDLTSIKIDKTAIVSTARGGRHYYFKYPKDLTIQNIITLWGKDPSKKADIKGEGGYVVAPPSYNKESGDFYTWIESLNNFSEAPIWLLEELKKIQKKKVEYHEIASGVEEGSRNDSASSFVGHILLKSDPEIWESVCWPAVLSWNDKNDPPLNEGELRGVFESIRDREFSRRKGYEEQPDLKNYEGVDKVVSSGEIKKLVDSENIEQSPSYYSLIPTLDAAIDGFKEGQLVVISAPTGQGKTSFCQTLTTNFASKNVRCLWFTYEVPVKEFLEKFTTVPNFYLPSRLKESSLDWLEERIRESILKYDTKIVFIDHLHFLMSMNELMATKNSSLLIGMYMRRLKKLALELGIVIFLISHLRKIKLEQLPEIDDLRDSSFIAQESDIVIIMWRDKQKDSSVPGGYKFTNAAKMFLTKNRRTGKLCFINLYYRDNTFVETLENNLELEEEIK